MVHNKRLWRINKYWIFKVSKWDTELVDWRDKVYLFNWLRLLEGIDHNKIRSHLSCRNDQWLLNWHVFLLVLEGIESWVVTDVVLIAVSAKRAISFTCEDGLVFVSQILDLLRPLVGLRFLNQFIRDTKLRILHLFFAFILPEDVFKVFIQVKL